MIKVRFNIPWKSILYSLYLVGGIVGVIILMGAVRTKSNEQACLEMRILIKGEEAFVEQSEIVSVIEREYGEMVGRTLNSIPTHEIEERLRAIPYVNSATVSVRMNGVLDVRIQQRSAVLRVIPPSGYEYYVDQMGLKMPVSLSYIPHVLVANGQIEEAYEKPLDTMKTSLVKDLYILAQWIQVHPLWSEQIAQLFVNDRVEIELISRKGDERILFGDASDLEDKFERLHVFYKGVVPKVGLNTYELVNLKYKDQLVCVRNKKVDSLSFSDKQMEPVTELNNNSLNIQ